MPVRRHHHDHRESTHENNTLTRRQQYKAVFSAILAVCIALLSIWSNQVNREILLARDTASNYWAYFHQKSLKERIYESELSFSSDLAPARIVALKENIQRYQGEQDQIKAQAEAKEAEVKSLLGKIHTVEIATVLLELAIILTSMSLIVPFYWLELIALLIGAAGAGNAIRAWL